MSKILILLFALFALTHAVFERTDCSCTCKDGKVCVKAVPNYLEGNTQECQCKDGTCPSGLEFNGKYQQIIFLCVPTVQSLKDLKIRVSKFFFVLGFVQFSLSLILSIMFNFIHICF